MRIYFKDLILCLIFHFILDGSNLVYGCITEEDCQVSNVKTSFLSSGTGLFEWESPEENTDECCNVTVFIASLSTNNSDALKWHNVKDENQKTIWNDNDIEPNLNSITKTDLTFLMCVDYKFSIQAKCVVKQNGQTQNRNESYLPGVISGPTVEKVFKGYSSQLFKNITIDVNKNNTLNITFDPSSVLTLCIPEYQLEIYDGHIDNPMNCSSVNCKIMEMKLINQTSVLLNTNFKNGITLKQCNYYTAFIKLLDPNAAGIYQSLPFIFDYTEKSDNDWKVNSFRVNTTGPDWFLLTWLPPLNYSECVINYVVRVYDDKFRQLNYTTLGKDTIKFNVSEETGYIITPCTNYYFCLIISGKRVSVNSTINGTTQNIAPGEVSDIAITNITSHSMTVVWAKPTYGLTCAVYYALEFTDNSGSLPVIYVDLNETIYVKYNLKPCVQYGIGIRTKGTEKDSQQVVTDGTTSPEVPGAVQTFYISEMGANDLSLTWTMPAIYPECVIYYNISWYTYVDQSFVNSVKITDPHVNSLKIDNLEPCWNYTFAIYCGGIIGISQLTNLSAFTNEKIPGPVQNVTVSRGDFQLVARWKPPKTAIHCVSHYVVRSRTINATETTLIERSMMNNYASLGRMKSVITDKLSDDLSTIKVLLDLIACVDYEIIITAASLSGGESEAVPVTQTTLPHEFSEPSEGKTIQIGQNWAELEWLVPFTNRNLCPLILFVATCYEPEGPAIAWNTTYRDMMGYVRLNITGLKPYTSYTCSGQAMNSADWSKPSSQVIFQTLQAAPNAPTNVHVLEKTSYSLEISWDKPTLIPGVLEEYNISIICAGPQYSVPETCTSKIITPSYWVTLSGFAEKALLERLLPYQKCTITVAAATGAGYGPISEPHVTFTLPNVSEVVRDVEVAVLYNESVLMWYAPCFSNGIISHFSIKLKGTREGFEPDPVLILNKLYDPDKPDLRYEQHLENLLPEYDYEVTISVFVNSVSNTCPAIINFKSSARIPEVPSESSLQIVNPNPKATDSPSENAKITLTKTLFNNKDGVIKYLAVLVGHEGLLGPGQSGLLIGEDGKCEWPNVRTWANATQESDVPIYQATPAWWNPFKEGSVEDKIDYVIGSESCSRDDVNVFCNGPLNPSTSYELKIRAFTSAGYQDSPSIMFVTDAAFPYDFLIKSIISFFVVIIFVLIIVAFVILRRSTWLAAIKKPNRLVTPQPQKDEEISDEMYLKELSVKKFLIHCNELLNDINKMKAEFLRLNTLSTQIELSCLAAQLPENKNKNRYINVFPYDSTRVVLEDYNDTDYINASYVSDDIDKSIEYIACQAPKDDTIDDFWKMIYQCKVQSIVMLCNFTEQGKQKCYSYIPEDNKIINSDGLTIVCTHKRVYSSHVERILSITKDDQVVSRAVTHFHFVDWPDFGVPAEAETMLNFCKAIRSASIGIGMVAVHCSAGIGRTGTYIATDILLRHIDLPVKISVFRTVLILREQRANMVQTEVQYSYIYKCLKYALDHPLLYFKRGRSVFESKRSRNKHNSRRGSRFSIASSITSR